jgi:hypothetical protein
MTSLWLHQLLTMGVELENYTPKIWANHYTKICALRPVFLLPFQKQQEHLMLDSTQETYLIKGHKVYIHTRKPWFTSTWQFCLCTSIHFIVWYVSNFKPVAKTWIQLWSASIAASPKAWVVSRSQETPTWQPVAAEFGTEMQVEHPSVELARISFYFDPCSPCPHYPKSSLHHQHHLLSQRHY